MKKVIISVFVAMLLFGSFAPTITHAQSVQKTEYQLKLELIATLQSLLKILLQQLAEAQAREGIVVTPVTPVAQTPSQPVEIIQPTQPTIDMAKKESTFDVLPPVGNTYFKKQTGISFEQLRDLAISTNKDVAKFRQQMSKASEKEVVEYLTNNGFTVTKK